MMLDTLSQFLDSHRPEWNLLISHVNDAYINFSLISKQYFIGFVMQPFNLLRWLDHLWSV